MAMVSEFKEFISRGNVIDLAVGVIIGAAFGKIVSSLVDLVIMPPIGMIAGGVDFSQFKLVLKPGDPAHKIAEVAVQYGAFLNTIIQFAIIAFAIFLVVKLLNRFMPKKAPAPAGPSAEVQVLTEIRELLKAK